MRILLTGASGFTGRAFAEAARAAGHTVLTLDCDLSDKVAMSRQVLQSEPDSVVHLAAISYVGEADASAFYAVNVVGTLNLLDALVSLPRTPNRVLLASSANIYGNCDDLPIVESQRPAPTNHYAMSKLAMEHMASTYCDRLPLIFTRPFNYTGRGQAAQFLIPKLVNHFARREATIELGNLAVEREFNDVQMVCAAYLKLLNYGQPGETYNICSGNVVTLQHVVDLLSGITGHKIVVRVNSAFVRRAEVRRLCGSPAKLQTLLAQHGEVLVNRPLNETLSSMLDAVEPSSGPRTTNVGGRYQQSLASVSRPLTCS